MNVESYKVQVSAVLCAHNPKPEFLRRVLESLKGQTLPPEEWEFILVDNASKAALSDNWDISWHSNNRHVLEGRLGLTPARLRGIAESVGRIIVFVDDDTVLAADYLQRALEIANQFPQIGAWGGECLPEWEVNPPEWTKPYWPNLTVRPVERDIWSNLGLDALDTVPWGAGLCVRAPVAQAYARRITDDPVLLKLDRTGASLTSCGDIDLALSACILGLGTGIFARLKLIHLIPKVRLTEDYIIRVVAGGAFSFAVLKERYNYPHNIKRISRLRRPFGRLRRNITHDPISRKILEAKIDAEQRALDEIEARRRDSSAAQF